VDTEKIERGLKRQGGVDFLGSDAAISPTSGVQGGDPAQIDFLPRDAMHKRGMPSPGVCPSVRHVRELRQNE